MNRIEQTRPPHYLFALLVAACGALSPLGARAATWQDAATVPAQETTQIWEGLLDAGIQKLRIEFHLSPTEEEGEVTGNMFSVDQGNAKIPIDSGTIKDGKMELKIKMIGGGFSGELNEAGDECEGQWSQGPVKLPLSLKLRAAGAAPMENKAAKTWADRPQRPRGPIPYQSEDVTFKNIQADVQLAGTLTLPKEKAKASVILVSGSGPQDRDESLMEHKPFLVLADHLTRQGIAVLRYDDRGVGKSTGNFGVATTFDFAQDARAAVEFVAQRDALKDSPIGIIGHSEGGLVAPMVANDSDLVDFIILLAGPAVDGTEIVDSQSRAMAKLMGASEEQLDRNKALNKALYKILRESKPEDDIKPLIQASFEEWVKTIPEEEQEIARSQSARVMALATPWFRFFATYDPAPALRKLKIPTLALLGEKDLQVLVNVNESPLKDALESNGVTGNEVVVFPGLNHLFQKAVTGMPTEYQSIDETMNKVALEKMANWILQRK